MDYKQYQVLDINIEDETQRNGREITVSVDTHEMITLKIGMSCTIRTDETGVLDLQHALERALEKISEIEEAKRTEEEYQRSAEAQMVQAGMDAREKIKAKKRLDLSEQQRVDVWDPQDPVNW